MHEVLPWIPGAVAQWVAPLCIHRALGSVPSAVLPRLSKNDLGVNERVMGKWLIVSCAFLSSPAGWDNDKKIGILHENFQTLKIEDNFEDIITKPPVRKVSLKMALISRLKLRGGQSDVEGTGRRHSLCCQRSCLVVYAGICPTNVRQALPSCLVLCLVHLFTFADAGTESISTHFGNHNLAWRS